jgi:8-oxo-dGTP pyrophosphatase MutT (NUDIX family)
MGAMSPSEHSLRLDRGSLLSAAVPVHPRSQVGALCWRRRNGVLKVLLVTSRETRRWIVPKGWVMDNRTPAASALVEAWEEAGVQGRAAEVPLGEFVYAKVLADGIALPVRVSLFAVEVLRQKTRYPEAAERDRRWFPVAEAAAELAAPDLSGLVLDWARGAADAGPAMAGPAGQGGGARAVRLAGNR